MKTATVLVILILIPGRGECGELDKAKLRGLVRMPTVSVYAELNFSSLFGVSLNCEKIDPAAEIARLQQPHKDAAAEVERCQRLVRLYRKLDRMKESKEAGARALGICRAQVREHPTDMRWLARLGDALSDAGELAEGEKLLRRAVKEAANDWESWLALARCVDRQAGREVMGDKYIYFHLKNEKSMIHSLFERKPTAEQIAAMRRLRQEARRYYDRAIALAPRETKPYFGRVGSLWNHAVVEAGLRMAKGEKVDLKKVLLSPECAADLARIARLRPNDPQVIGAAALWEYLSSVLHDKMEVEKGNPFAALLKASSGDLTDLLPAKSRDFIRWSKNRLEQLEKSENKKTAADAAEALVDLLLMTKGREDESSILPASYNPQNETEQSIRDYLQFGEQGDPRRKILEHLRRLVQLDPSRERAWDTLAGMLAQTRKLDEAVTVCQKRIAVRDTAHNRFFLAKIYAEQSRFDRAAEQLRAGLKREPKDWNCLLGLVAVLLKRSDNEALKQAGEELDIVEARAKEDKEEGRKLNYLLLRGFHAALSARPTEAKKYFEQVLRRDKSDTAAARGWAILGDRVGPPDAQLAIDYIHNRKGFILRNRKQPGSPVAEVRLIDDKWTDEDLYFLSAFPALASLELWSGSISDAGMLHVKRLTALRELNLQDTKITDAGLAHLEGLRKLESIVISCRSIDESPSITDEGIAHLRKLPELQKVYLRFPLTDKGLAHLAALPRLQYLSASHSKITNDGMSHFAPCRELRQLRLYGGIFSDAGLTHLKGLRNLLELDLDNTRITDAGLVHLEGLKNLEKLTLADTVVTDAGLVHLRGLTNLRRLDLQGNSNPFEKHSLNEGMPLPRITDEEKKPGKPRITDAGLKHLQALGKLEELNLNEHPITDAGLTSLKGLNNLRSLSLKQTRITDAGLRQLHEWKQLKSIDLRESKVTREGIARLKKALPKLEISH